MSEPLHIKYRPTALADVIGQDGVIGSLEKLWEKPDAVPHSYLFLGPSGVGKTTLARILGAQLDCSIIEIDAATHSGVDAMREVTAHTRYKALGQTTNKLVIVDEAHALSKATFQSLLKAIEEPPEHAYWCLCTTEGDKIPRTIKTRCVTYTLNSVSANDLFDYLSAVAKNEKIRVDSDILQVCARQAFGSVRQALVNLSTVSGCRDRKEAYRLLSTVQEDGEVVELARMLVSGAQWGDLREVILRLKDENPESIRMIVVHYVQRVLLDAKDAKRVPKLLAILEAFSQPFNSNEKMAPVLLAVGGLLYG